MTAIYELHSLTASQAEVLEDLLGERDRQDLKFGEQNHADGTGPQFAGLADSARDDCDSAFAAGRGSWAHILREELYEALAESDPVRLRSELLQVAAVAVGWIQAIDRRPTP